MRGNRPLNVVLLPTLECNAACDYCFEVKADSRLSLDVVPRLAEALLEHMEVRGSAEAEIYWQGGEVLLMGVPWFERANELMGKAAAARGLAFRHHLQTNLIGYTAAWNPLLLEMFGGSLGTSMDFPNLHRRLRNGSTGDYDAAWTRAVREVTDAGLHVGVIAVAHAATLAAGPEAFYEFFTRRAGVTDFQVNTPFPGGPGRHAEPLDVDALSGFLRGLMDLFVERGFGRGVRLGPFDALIDSFSGRPAQLPCFWQPSCADEFLSIDARGEVALCDCWVTSYPEHRFGNLFGPRSLGQILSESPARRAFLERPERLAASEDCLACPFLSLCHGGCPVRTFTVKGTLHAKDPYCEVYKAVFERARYWAGVSPATALNWRVKAL